MQYMIKEELKVLMTIFLAERRIAIITCVELVKPLHRLS
jgi:hypothetical protein